MEPGKTSFPPSSKLQASRRAPGKILVIGLSNVGDGVLMSPVIARLAEGYPQARVTVLVGERARALFAGDPRVHELMMLEEFAGWSGRLRLIGLLWRMRPALLIDLRHTALPLVWKPWRCWRYVWPVPKHLHMRERHLWRLKIQGGSKLQAPSSKPTPLPPAIWISPEDQRQVTTLASRWGLAGGKPLVIICPGARSHTKRWYTDRFAAVADGLIEEAGAEVVLTGEPEESEIIHDVMAGMRRRAHSAVGCTTIRQLAALMQQARLVITNDSASLHVAGAVGAPVLALFGPTDPRKYGPTGGRDRVVQRRLFCVPCEKSLCRYTHECMRFIQAEDVLSAAKAMLRDVPM